MTTFESDNALLPGVSHVILVLSGKGGVGKSTVATQLATALVAKGKKVGLLDIDLCGPSVPKMLNLDTNNVFQCDQGWVPVFADKEQKLSVMSIAFLLENKTDPVVWRGPKKNAMIKQFLSDVAWGEQDYLIIDTPPGTSDEHISVVESLQKCSPDGAILVTTPQGVSVADVRRELTFCRKLNLPILGIVENMSGFVCPCCAEHTNIFSSGGGKALAEASGVPYLGSVPLDPELASSLEKGENFMQNFQKSPAWEALNSVAEEIVNKTSRKV